MIREPDPALPSVWVSVLFVESQTQLLSSAESLCCVECEHDSELQKVQRYRGTEIQKVQKYWGAEA